MVIVVDMIHIYIYENLVNGKVYIGQSYNLAQRDKDHISDTKNMPIDRAITKHGRANFSLHIITSVETYDQADDAEIEWIARAREVFGKENVYNISNGGNSYSMRGRRHTDETKKKMSESSKGQIPWMLGKKHTEETRKQMSESHMGNQDRLGIPHSEESKKKISESNKGKIPWNVGIPQTDEAKEKNRQANLGRLAWNKSIQQTEETKEKIRQANLGKRHSEESKLKMSLSQMRNTKGRKDIPADLIKNDTRKPKVIADEYGISKTTVYRIKNGSRK